jgi:uncharacterized protein (DUF736 family)
METKNNSGVIFKNDKKTSEKAPDYNGKIVVDGKEKQIALWLKTSDKGTKYFSVAISEPYKKDAVSEEKGVSQPDNDLPF